MWRTLKMLFLLWPIPVMIYLAANYFIDQASVDKLLTEAHGLIWKDEEKQIKVTVIQNTQGEERSYEIILLDKNNKKLQQDIFVIDIDMFGGGFVKAFQADNAQYQELLVWGSHEREKSYMLTFSNGEIKRTSFAEFPEQVNVLTEQWLQAYVGNRVTVIAFLALTIGYYCLLGIILGLTKVVRFFRNRKA
jgi:hypothetical protein